MDLIEYIECLHHWLSLETITDVLIAMNSDGLIFINDWKKDGDFSAINDLVIFINDFIWHFYVFIDLSLVVF